MGGLDLCRCRRWYRIMWADMNRCCQGYWWLINPSGGGIFCTYLLCRASFTVALISTKLSWRLGKILIEFIHYGGRLCNFFLADVAMFGQGSTSNILVELQTWWVVWFVEVTDHAGIFVSLYFRNKFPRYPPWWWLVYWGVRSCGRAGTRLGSNGWRGRVWGVGNPVFCDWRCGGRKSQRLLSCLSS